MILFKIFALFPIEETTAIHFQEMISLSSTTYSIHKHCLPVSRGPQLKFTLKSNLIFFTFRPFFSLIYFFNFFSFVSFSSLFLLYFPFFLTFLHLLLLSLIFFPFSHFFIFTSPTGKPLAADDRH